MVAFAKRSGERKRDQRKLCSNLSVSVRSHIDSADNVGRSGGNAFWPHVTTGRGLCKATRRSPQHARTPSRCARAKLRTRIGGWGKVCRHRKLLCWFVENNYNRCIEHLTLYHVNKIQKEKRWWSAFCTDEISKTTLFSRTLTTRPNHWLI